MHKLVDNYRKKVIHGGRMTKADLIQAISQETGIILKDTKIIVDALLDNIKVSMIDGEHIELRGFGTFKNKVRKARIARNPNTKELVNLPKRVVPTFKFSKFFIDEVMKNN
jgi:DNA-binding protein HU-beta/integration host factor subunit beta